MNSSSKIKFHLSFFFILSIFLLQPLNIYGEIKVNNGKVTFINESGKVDELIKKTASILGVKVFTHGDYSYVENINIKSGSFDNLINYLMSGSKYIIKKTNNDWNVYTKSSQNYLDDIIFLHKTKYISTSTILDNIHKFDLNTKIVEISKSGSLIIYGKVNDVIDTVDLINTLDTAKDIFTVELLVVEYFHQDGFKWGIDITNGSYGNFDSSSFTPGAANGNIDLTYNLGAAANQAFKLNLQALVEESSAKIFQNPRLSTQDGNAASIDITEDKYVQLQAASMNGLTTTLKKLTAGIKLNITPSSISGSIINLSLKGTISEFVPFTSEGEYSIESRDIETKIEMEVGQTLIIGGLIKEEEIRSKGGIPLLKDIPLIGNLFSRKLNRTATIETVIYVTVYKKNPFSNNRNVLFDDNKLKNSININTN
jgi:type II secretory pathway component GspD/PulD (secretin)